MNSLSLGMLYIFFGRLFAFVRHAFSFIFFFVQIDVNLDAMLRNVPYNENEKRSFIYSEKEYDITHTWLRCRIQIIMSRYLVIVLYI